MTIILIRLRQALIGSKLTLPFSEFKRSKSRSTALDIDEIRDFGIVAFGRDFKSDVSVSKIDFY